MENIIACNLGSYRQFRASAYEHLAAIGLNKVEIPVPPAAEVDQVGAELARYGLEVTTVMLRGDLGEEGAVERFGRDLETAQKLGVRRIFTSVRAGEQGPEEVYGRLRQVGDEAARCGIVVCMETHPDLIENGDRALETMRAVDHDHIRVNYDTGNIYFYNQGATASGELAKILDYVEAVHLKDTNGGYRTWHFPALGRGVVDFKEVFTRLNGRGFYGPFTMELEGIEGEELDEAGVRRRVEDSLAHLRSLGCAA